MSQVKPDDVMVVISEVFAPREVSVDSSFDDLEADSVLMLRLMVALQRKFNVVLDIVDMFDVEVIGDLLRLVEERVPHREAPPA